MHVGLAQAGFQQLLLCKQWQWALDYMDNIVIFSC